MTCDVSVPSDAQTIFNHVKDLFQANVLGGGEVIPESTEWYVITNDAALMLEYYSISDQQWRERDPTRACCENLYIEAAKKGFYPKEALAASGYATVRAPVGTAFPPTLTITLDGTDYDMVSIPPAVMPASENYTIRVQAQTVGIETNLLSSVRAGTLNPSIAGFNDIVLVGGGSDDLLAFINSWSAGASDITVVESIVVDIGQAITITDGDIAATSSRTIVTALNTGLQRRVVIDIEKDAGSTSAFVLRLSDGTALLTADVQFEVATGVAAASTVGAIAPIITAVTDMITFWRLDVVFNGDNGFTQYEIFPAYAANNAAATGAVDVTQTGGITITRFDENPATLTRLGGLFCGGSDDEECETFRTRYLERLAYKPDFIVSRITELIADEWNCVTRVFPRDTCCQEVPDNCCRNSAALDFHVLFDTTFDCGIAPIECIAELNTWLFGSRPGFGEGRLGFGVCGEVVPVQRSGVTLTISQFDCTVSIDHVSINERLQDYFLTLKPAASIKVDDLRYLISQITGSNVSLDVIISQNTEIGTEYGTFNSCGDYFVNCDYLPCLLSIQYSGGSSSLVEGCFA